MRYEVRALHRNAVTSLQVEALDEADARAQVIARSLQPISVEPLGKGLGRARGGAQRLSLTLFSQELLALLDGGLTIVEAVGVLCDNETRPAIRGLYTAIARGLSEGKSFSACIEEMPHLFPALYVGIIRSAERTSSLTRALTRYIDYQTRLDAVRGKLVSAAIYPTILLVVGTGVVAFLGIYVVPRFATIYQGTGRPLPLLSEWLLAWGRLAATHAWQLGVGTVVAAVAGFFGVRALVARGYVGAVLKRIPWLAARVRIYELTRLYLTLGMLLEAGLPATEAMRLARGTVGADMRSRVDAAAREVVNGESLPAAFERAGLSTPVAARFMQVGERSGRLAEMLQRSARYYDEQIARWIERFTRTFEPLLMVGIGAIVGLIVVLLYMPIFDLAGSFK
jgi:general secretion pathway protein F